MTDTRQLTSECWTNGTDCESCGAPRGAVVLRATSYGTACLVLCQSCQQTPEPVHQWTDFAVTDHQAHITRARDAGELP